MTKALWFFWGSAIVSNFFLTFGVNSAVRDTPLGWNVILGAWLAIALLPFARHFREFFAEPLETRRRVLRIAWHLCFFPMIGLGLVAMNMAAPPELLVRAVAQFGIATAMLTIPLYPIEARIAHERSRASRRFDVWIETEHTESV